MIDTDKYENHDMIRIAKQLLIEDAPLLLEEIKRLREDNELYLACIHASHFRDKPGSAMSKLNQERFLQRGEEE
tara:strand:+ start:191 stop:412 length:222 start_codon:yes stop_codon:yes gene_type:complete